MLGFYTNGVYKKNMLQRKSSSICKATEFMIWNNHVAYATPDLLISLKHRKKPELEKWKLELYCVIVFPPCQTPLHYLWRSQTPAPAFPHRTENFIASICFCLLDFPSESMFTT